MKQKILIVEDDVVIRQLVAKHLRNWNYEVAESEDFQRILEQVEDFQPHLILMDIGLPFFNGYYWCQEIRKVSIVPILFLSSRDQPMDIVMAINLGGDELVIQDTGIGIAKSDVERIFARGFSGYNGRISLKEERIVID